MVRYQHTQIGYVTITASAIGLLFIVGLMAVYGFDWIPFAVLIILGVCLVLFATLTVVIDENVLEIRFGPGVIRKKSSFKKRSTEVTTIRLTEDIAIDLGPNEEIVGIEILDTSEHFGFEYELHVLRAIRSKYWQKNR